MAGHKPVTCESESEGDDVATELPAHGDDNPKKSSNPSASPAAARQERPPETRKHSSRSSDSGYSTGTKGSGDTKGATRTSSREHPVVPPPEIVPQSPSRSARPSLEHKASSARSGASQRSQHSSQGPSRAPSTKSRSVRSEGRIDVSQLHGPPETGSQARREQRDPSELHRTESQRAARTSPPSSRASRAPSRTSQEMPPPPLPRSRSISANRGQRPSSFHAGMGIPYDAYYAAYGTPYGSYERDYGPPPARSAFVNKGSVGYPVRPALSVMPAGYHDQAVVHRPGYDPARTNVAHRTHTEYSTASTPSQYSARHPVSYYPDQPGMYDASAARSRGLSQPPSPHRERNERKRVSARQPSHDPTHEDYMFDQDLSGSEGASDEDYDDYEEGGGKYMPKQQQPRSFNGHLSARGLPAAAPAGPYGTSPHRELADPYLDEGFISSSDYRSSVRSKESAGSHSTQSRRLSIASSDRGTKATSYSASSGSGGYPAQRRIAGYDQFQTTQPDDNKAEAERYMRQMDAQAKHVRQQQPAVTQESLRQHNARAIEPKRSSRPSVSASAAPSSSSRVSGSRRSRTITAAEEQTIRLNIDTTGGVNVELEGDTEGRPIKFVQRPGETRAQLIIGSSGAGAGAREQTVYSGGSAARTSDAPSRVSGRTGSTRGAVSGRRERARTEV